MRSSTLGVPGTIRLPVAVDTSTSRRQRCGFWKASCWATPPPQEYPSTSNPVVAELGEHPPGQPGEPGKRVGQPRHRRATYAGYIETHHFDGRVQGADERLDRLERRADAVAEQQRRSVPGTGTDRDAQRLLADRHQAGPVRYAGHGA